MRPCVPFFVRPVRTSPRREAILTDARRGLLNPKPMEPSGRTYGDACQAYLRYIEVERGRAHSTVRGYRATAQRYLLPALGKTRLGDACEGRLRTHERCVRKAA